MKLRRDSLLHAETCALLCIVFSFVLPLWLSGVLAFAAGLGKEIWDKYHDGVPSWTDVLWDLAGAAIGALIAYI